MNFLTENWSEIVAATVAVGTAASIVVKLTTTDKDDKILAKVVKVLSLFGIKLVK